MPANPARASPAAATSTIAVLVRPYAQRALLDGVQVASGAQRVVFPLVHGQPHRIQIEHDCCVTFVRDFAADEVVPPQLELRVPLEPRPARLRVDAEPEARVLVDGRLVGTAGDSRRRPLAVPVPSGAATPYEGYAEIRVESPGQPPHVTQAKIRAGAELTVVAPSALLHAPEPESAAAAEDSEPGATASKEPAP